MWKSFWESGYEGKLERLVLFHFPCSKDERRADARFSKDIQSENVCRSFARNCANRGETPGTLVGV